MNPYRFITKEEQEQLEQRLRERLGHWDEAYSQKPMHCRLESPANSIAIESCHGLADAEGQTLLVYDATLESLLCDALFGEVSDAFLETCQKLLVNLCEQLTNTALIRIKPAPGLVKSWNYKGSAQQWLHLSTDEGETSLLLSPSWVRAQLATTQGSNKPVSIDKALADHKLVLDVQLDTVRLPLQKLKGLKPGDLLVTDHPIDKTLRLTFEHQPVAEVSIGQNQDHKSIKIERFL